ncbi:hypothetical protein quinque_005232 [Culex quinquefasciatus]
MAKVKVPFPQKEAIKSAGMRIPFSSIVELVLSTMSGPTRAIVEPLVPFFRAIDEEPEQESSGVELTFRPGGGDRKKKEQSRNQLDKTGKVLKDTSLLADKEDFNQAFPPVGSTRKHQEMAKVKVPFPQKEAIKSAGMRIPFSSIVELVLSTMSGPTRAIVEPLVPFFRAIVKQYAENSILLEFISFDS